MQVDARDSRVFLDRLEDEVAVLILGEDEELPIPRSLLPDGAVEGNWLVLRLTIDVKETEDRRLEIEERRRRLGSNDDGGDLDL